jgi:CubicO group peptidase (beta-lactamase class C family)
MIGRQKRRHLLASIKHWMLLFVVSLCSLPGCDETNPVATYRYSIPLSTNDGWETASLSSVGMNEELISFLADNINHALYTEVHSVLIVKENRLVFEEYWGGHDFGLSSPDYHGTYVQFDRNRRHNTHSATKSITSALVGIANDKGLIGGVDEKIFRYLPNHQSLSNEGRENITIEHALTMSSGLQWKEWGVSVSSPEHDVVQFNQSSDPIRYLLSKPLVEIPGTLFCYNGGTVDLLGVIVKNATGSDLPTFSGNYLFGPLGITNYVWTTLYPSGITCAHGDILMTPRDMARFGFLFLNNGSWKGVQIISADWVQKSTSYHISPNVSWVDGYGYLWWLRTYHSGGQSIDAFRAHGWGGQQIIIFPTHRMVVVFTGANYTTDEPCDAMVERFILPAVQ